MSKYRYRNQQSEIFITDNDVITSLPDYKKMHDNNKYIKQLKKELTMEQKMKYGIDNLTNVLAFVIDGANTTKNVLSDGKIDWTELPAYFSVVLKLPKAIDSLGGLPLEVSDLDEVEKEEVLLYIKSKLEFPEKAELVLDNALKMLYYGYQIIKSL